MLVQGHQLLLLLHVGYLSLNEDEVIDLFVCHIERVILLQEVLQVEDQLLLHSDFGLDVIVALGAAPVVDRLVWVQVSRVVDVSGSVGPQG